MTTLIGFLFYFFATAFFFWLDVSKKMKSPGLFYSAGAIVGATTIFIWKL